MAPIAPHITEEIWQNKYGSDKNDRSVHQQTWPDYDPNLTEEQNVTMAVQINGKTRGTVIVGKGTDQQSVEEVVLNEVKLEKNFEGRKIVKIVFVMDKIINFLIS